MTNGEKIKAIFPHYDIEIDEHKGYVKVFYKDFYTTYPLRWWNADSQSRPDKERLLEVLDKISAEIKQRPYGIANDSVIQGMKYERVAILEILDKYKADIKDT